MYHFSGLLQNVLCALFGLFLLLSSVSSIPTAVEVLAEELATTERLILQYQKKLSVLRHLHQGLKSGHSQPEVIDAIVANINARTQSSQVCAASDRNSGSALVVPIQSKSASRYMAKRSLQNVNGIITTVQVVGIPQRGGGAKYRARTKTAVQTFDVIVFTRENATANGQYLSLQNNAGDELFTHSLERHKTTVTHVACSLSSRDPFIATADREGFVQVHNSTLYQLGRYVAGRMYPPRDRNGRVIKKTTGWRKDGLDIKVAFENEIFQTPGKVAIVGIGIKRARYHDMIVVVDAIGEVHMLLRNGTIGFQFSLNLNSANMYAYKIGAMLPGLRSEPSTFAIGGNLRFVMPPNPKPLPHDCEGTTDPITSIAKDCMRRQFYYAGTRNGEILVFDTTGTTYRQGARRSAPVGGKKGGFSRCALLYKLPCVGNDATPSNVDVYTVQGAVIGISESGFSVAYNTTEVWKRSPTMLWSFDHNITGAINGRKGARRMLSAGVTTVDGSMPLSNGATIVLVEQSLVTEGKKRKRSVKSESAQLTLHRLLVPYYEPVASDAFSVAWLRGPIMVLVLVAVFMYQVYKRRSRPVVPSMASMFGADVPNFGGMSGSGGGGRGMSGGGMGDGGRGMNPDKMQGLLQMLEKSGGGGHGLAQELRQHQSDTFGKRRATQGMF